jgi:predicted transcriptional regulator
MMPALSKMEKKERYYKIFCQIYEEPRMQIYEVAKALGIYRKSVSKALQEMVNRHMLVGPELRLKPLEKNPKMYYVLDYDEPFKVYEKLIKNKDLTYIGVVFGDFPLIAAGEPGVPFEEYPGFNRILFSGKRGEIYTPRASSISWEGCGDRILEEVKKSEPWEMSTWVSTPVNIPWDQQEWEFFYEFRGNIRHKIAPLVREKDVSFRKFYDWLNTVEDYTTIHTGFYPEGYSSYTTYLFLFKTAYEHALMNLFSLLPTTPIFFKVGTYLFTMINIKTDLLITSLSRAIYTLKEESILEDFYKGVVVMHYTPD